MSLSSLASKSRDVQLVSPGGRAVRPDDWGVRMSAREGYVNVSV